MARNLRHGNPGKRRVGRNSREAIASFHEALTKRRGRDRFVVYRLPMIAVRLWCYPHLWIKRDKRPNRPNLPIRVTARSDDGEVRTSLTRDAVAELASLRRRGLVPCRLAVDHMSEGT